MPESATAGTLLTPGLIASQPQGLTFNFSVAPSTVFGIVPTTGVLYLQNLVTLNFKTTNFYALTVAVTTSAGTSASTSVGVLVTEVIKPPVFTAPAFFASISEGVVGGTAITTVTATSSNTVDTLRYVLVGANPAGATPWFTLDPISGALSVSFTVAGGALLVNPALSYPAGFYTVNVSVSVFNSGGLSANATAVVAITNIAPRVIAVNATINANTTGGVVIADVAPAVWTPYAGADLIYSLTSATTPVGFQAFTMSNASTGVVAVTNVSYVDVDSGLTYRAPGFNINVQPVVISSWQVFDASRGRSATGSLVVTLRQSNRAPWWTSIPVIFAPQTIVAGLVGTPLSAYANDLDLALGIGTVLGGRSFAMFGFNTRSLYVRRRGAHLLNCLSQPCWVRHPSSDWTALSPCSICRHVVYVDLKDQ